MEEVFPCPLCIVMAMCNAKMHQYEEFRGQNAMQVYRGCQKIRRHIDLFYTTQQDESTWKVSLMPIHRYFMDDIHDTFIITDHIKEYI